MRAPFVKSGRDTWACRLAGGSRPPYLELDREGCPMSIGTPTTTPGSAITNSWFTARPRRARALLSRGIRHVRTGLYLNRDVAQVVQAAGRRL